MKTFAFLIIISVIAAFFFRFVADGRTLGNGPLLSEGLNYLIGTVVDVPMDVLNPPRNTNDSVGYRVYTRRNPKQPCFLEPTLESLKRCQINPDDPLILLVSGFIESLKPGNLFEVMKDKILTNGPHTVIILDWTKYDGPPYTLAIENMIKIGPLAGYMLNFIVKNAGVKAENMRITGHSLGGHLVGHIGRNVPNLGQIDSLDPVGIFFTTLPFFSKISHTDAKFVRVIHTSNEQTGLGLSEPLGDIDFYVNGGTYQPHCHYGARYERTSGDEVTVDNIVLKQVCPHELANLYYINSINSTDCQFLATNCDSYQDFKDGKCPPETSAVADMGFYGKKIDGLPVKSKFYLRTSQNTPFCLKNGDKPSPIQESMQSDDANSCTGAINCVLNTVIHI